MNPQREYELKMTRRQLFSKGAAGIGIALLLPMTATNAQTLPRPTDRQKDTSDQVPPTRKLASLSAAADGKDYLLTLWDIPSLEDARIKRAAKPNPNHLYLGGRTLCLMAKEITKPETTQRTVLKPKAENAGNVVVLAYWSPMYLGLERVDMVAALSQAPDGHIFLVRRVSAMPPVSSCLCTM